MLAFKQGLTTMTEGQERQHAHRGPRGSSSSDPTPAEDAAAEHARAGIATATAALQQLNEAALQRRLAAMDKHIGHIFEALPVNALLVVATGQGDTPGLSHLYEMRSKGQQRVPGVPAWSFDDEARFSEQSEAEMKALCFCAVKK